VNKIVRLAALQAGAIYEGDEQRAEPRHDRLCEGLRMAVKVLEALRQVSPAWAIWRWVWVPAAVQVLEAVVAARCGGGESVESGAR
jgi:hypothetical protein